MRITGRGAGWDGYVLRRVVGAWIAVALALGLSAGSALATAPGVNGPIVFSSGGKIFTIQPDGSGLHPVVRADEEHKYDFYPSWSPDGLRIVASGQMRNPDGYWTDTGLQIFSPDGTSFQHLPIFGFIEDPAWSPDGARILFVREQGLFSTTPDGSSPALLESDAWSPAWSPDGSRIAFIRPPGPYAANNDTDLYTMSAAGGGAQQLLDLPGRVISPSWSPDGSTIVFTYSAREARDEPGSGQLPYTYSGPNVYAVAATGGQPVRLTESGTDMDPVWSPDGSTIAFQSNRLSVDTPDLFLMNADGSNERRLTTTHCLQCGADWASLPPHSRPSAPAVVVPAAEPRRKQEFSSVSMTRTRFTQPSRVRVRFRAAVAEKVGFTIRRATPPDRAFRCGREPGACLLVGREERQAREGLNRIPLGGLLGSALTPGRYWLRLSSSSGRAHAGLAFRVLPPRDRRQPHSDRR
jgi:Tol biopolymer transport system component